MCIVFAGKIAQTPLCAIFYLINFLLLRRQRSAGLIRRFKYVMEDRINHPEKYAAEKDKYFQRAWSGEQFKNLKWADQHGDGKNFTWQER